MYILGFVCSHCHLFGLLLLFARSDLPFGLHLCNVRWSRASRVGRRSPRQYGHSVTVDGLDCTAYFASVIFDATLEPAWNNQLACVSPLNVAEFPKARMDAARSVRWTKTIMLQMLSQIRRTHAAAEWKLGASEQSTSTAMASCEASLRARLPTVLGRYPARCAMLHPELFPAIASRISPDVQTSAPQHALCAKAPIMSDARDATQCVR